VGLVHSAQQHLQQKSSEIVCVYCNYICGPCEETVAYWKCLTDVKILVLSVRNSNGKLQLKTLEEWFTCGNLRSWSHKLLFLSDLFKKTRSLR